MFTEEEEHKGQDLDQK